MAESEVIRIRVSGGEKMDFINKLFSRTGKQDKQEHYLVFCILGKVYRDRDKLHFLDQWMKCYALLDNFLSDCGTKTIFSEQVFCKIKPSKKKGQPKTNYSKAPTGGLMKWDEKNNQKICMGRLETVLKQLETAAQTGLPLQEWIETQYPRMDTFVTFNYHEVLARIEVVNNLNRNGFNDFIFRISCSSDVMRGLPANQQISMFISERYVKNKGKEKIDSFVREVGKLAHAIKIAATNMPISIIEHTSVPGSERINTLIWSDYGDIFNCTFKPNPAGDQWAPFA